MDLVGRHIDSFPLPTSPEAQAFFDVNIEVNKCVTSLALVDTRMEFDSNFVLDYMVSPDSIFTQKKLLDQDFQQVNSY